MNRAEQALQAFREGANCAQSVVSAFAGEYGLDQDTALAVARGFGSGMATGSTCGVISGATLIIGLATGITVDNKEAKPKAYRLVKDFTWRFRERYGSTICRDLMGCDVSDPSQAQHARERDLFNRICSPMIRDTVMILEEILPPRR
ncbi:MAG: C-GCAxxG-C-C family protein [Methanomicrobiales archaeon]|nr:C-GCAxxG-C-C family protein [Methanomicrobiales archaeon]